MVRSAGVMSLLNTSLAKMPSVVLGAAGFTILVLTLTWKCSPDKRRTHCLRTRGWGAGAYVVSIKGSDQVLEGATGCRE